MTTSTALKILSYLEVQINKESCFSRNNRTWRQKNIFRIFEAVVSGNWHLPLREESARERERERESSHSERRSRNVESQERKIATNCLRNENKKLHTDYSEDGSKGINDIERKTWSKQHQQQQSLHIDSKGGGVQSCKTTTTITTQVIPRVFGLWPQTNNNVLMHERGTNNEFSPL